MRTTLIPLLLLGFIAVNGLQAQGKYWGVTPEVGFSQFGGTAVKDSAGESRHFHPSSSISIGLRIDRTTGSVGFAVSLLYDQTGMVETGDPIALTVHDIVKLYSIRPEITFRVVDAGPSSLFVHGGPVFERWQLAGEDPRHRVGGQGAISIRAPLGGRLALQVRWEATLSPSILERQELPAGFRLRSNLHSRLGLGIRLRL